MTLLLDTHVLVWLVEGTPDLVRSSRNVIDRAVHGEGVAISAISIWEVAMLVLRGRMAISHPIEEWYEQAVIAQGITECPVTGPIGIDAARIGRELPGDPGDRIIVATARLNGWRLATRDKRILAYGAAGHVKVVRV